MTQSLSSRFLIVDGILNEVVPNRPTPLPLPPASQVFKRNRSRPVQCFSQNQLKLCQMENGIRDSKWEEEEAEVKHHFKICIHFGRQDIKFKPT